MRSLAILSLLLAGASAWAAVDIKLPVPEIEKLPNGLEVAWFVNDSLPVVDLILTVKSGYRDDPQGKSGTAELVSSLLDRGDAGLNEQQIARQIERLGASRYITADDDTFSVGMHGLAPDALSLLDLLSMIALHPDFPKAEAQRESARLIDRWNHIGDYGETLVSLAFHRLVAAGTDYGRGNFLSVDEFRKVTRQDVVDFHRNNFTPKNSILVIVGRVDKALLHARLIEKFGAWTGEAPAHATRKYSDPRLSAKPGEVVLVDRPGLTQAQVRIGFKAPLFQDPDHYSLVVANALLGEYFGSRLNSVIRDKLGLTYSIGSSFSYSKDFAKFAISSATRNEAVGQLIRKTLEILKDLRKGPIEGDEVKMAKDYLVGGFPLGVATLGAVASRWLGGYTFDLGPGYLNEFEPKVSAVTPSEVRGAIVKHFPVDRLVIVVSGDGASIGKSLSAAGIKYKRVTVKELK